MAEKSSFFNSVNADRKYGAADWAAFFATFISSGVVLMGGNQSALVVTATGGSMSVSVAKGSAFITGYRYENTTALELPLETAHASMPRIDSVVLRWSRTGRNITACISKGTAAAVPAANAPTRTADVYELCIARVYVPAGATSVALNAITDARLNSDLCGVATMIGDLDTTTLYQQIQADLAAFKSGEQADFTTWSNAREAAFAAWELAQETAFATWSDEQEADFATWSQNREAAFDAWFATLTTTLSEDVAGNLYALITQHTADVITNAEIDTVLNS